MSWEQGNRRQNKTAVRRLRRKEIELRNNGTALQWRYTDSNEWTELILIDDIKGPAGETPTFEIREGNLYAIYK